MILNLASCKVCALTPPSCCVLCKPTGSPSFLLPVEGVWVSKGRMWSRSLERAGSKVGSGRTNPSPFPNSDLFLNNLVTGPQDMENSIICCYLFHKARDAKSSPQELSHPQYKQCPPLGNLKHKSLFQGPGRVQGCFIVLNHCFTHQDIHENHLEALVKQIAGPKPGVSHVV